MFDIRTVGIEQFTSFLNPQAVKYLQNSDFVFFSFPIFNTEVNHHQPIDTLNAKGCYFPNTHLILTHWLICFGFWSSISVVEGLNWNVFRP
jgi:hypothetical protein